MSLLQLQQQLAAEQQGRNLTARVSFGDSVPLGAQSAAPCPQPVMGDEPRPRPLPRHFREKHGVLPVMVLSDLDSKHLNFSSNPSPGPAGARGVSQEQALSSSSALAFRDVFLRLRDPSSAFRMPWETSVMQAVFDPDGARRPARAYNGRPRACNRVSGTGRIGAGKHR